MRKEVPRKRTRPFEWSSILKDLAKRIGSKELYERGLALLGYPPNLVTNGTELIRLRELERGRLGT